ncbi:hypothetical protein NGM10_10270 [Halorussus salilacus]|uniref:DUF7282 domain-containing protein n=1 Tax=Halorussus salilacus TaxID=2953750 RepID=UPI00209F7C28|nr:hypothetical protein [Halorussus salilacus]USZ67114.1 hypothetical protein NGM10_10270 [Halorussus salilacus]
MTRDSRTLSAVFMAVLLILASGTAVSLAVTDSGSTVADSNASVQDETTTEAVETTEDEEETEVDDETETTTREADEPAEGDQADVTINEQESDGEQVVIESATLPEGGFVTIHDETLLEGDALGSVVGVSTYLEAGTHEDVTITLGRPLAETQTVIAMPHYDDNENQVYDFIISGGGVDAPYTSDGEAVVDDATVTVDGVEETTEEVEETTTEEVEETTTEEVVETTTEEVEETTTEEVEETTTEEVVETTTEEEDELEETTTEEIEEPADQQQFIFKVEQMNIDRWSFVLGDEEEPDRTETVSDITVQDRRVEINLTELMQEQAEMEDGEQLTTPGPEAQEQLEENLTGDIETVRFVIENVNVENVTFVITAPEDMEMPEPPMTPEETTTEEDEVIEETTTEEEEVETTTEEEEVETTTEEEEVETTTEEEVEETTTEEEEVETTTEEEDEFETTTEEEDEFETTTEEEEVETTTEEEDVETTTEEEEVETTTEEPDEELESFDVTALNAPESAEIGDTVNVSAVVTNPNDAEATQDVAFRLDGTVIARDTVTLNGSTATTVSFEVDTTDVPPGEYVHGVYTQDFGELAVIMLEEPTAEETTEDDDEETVIETTAAEDDDEETVIETTTAEDDDEETVIETTTAAEEEDEEE